MSLLSDGNISVRHMWKVFQLPDMSDRLHMVAKKITSWKEKPNSSALDNYRTIEAGVKWTAAKYS